MSIVLSADNRSWLEIPQSFPTAGGQSAQDWEDRVVRGMREAWNGGLDDAMEEVVRSALRHGLSRVLPEDSVTLQYWPTASIVNAIVHVSANSFGPGETRKTIPLDDGPFVVEPRSVPFESEFLGTGVESRALVALDTEPQMVVGVLNYLFENSTGYVFVGIDATIQQLVGIVLEPLREIVRSIRVVDDDGGAWEKSDVDLSLLALSGETWTSEGAEVSR